MILEKLTVHDFGVFKGEQTVELAPPSPKKPIILFGGLNGTGKTTLLDAIQLCLYGKLAHCSNRGDLSYGDFLRRCINHTVNPSDGASITLDFRHFSEGQEHTFKIHRSWSFNGKSPNEWVEVYRDGEYEKLMTNIWNEQVEEFIPSRISQLFFFDGEKIETLADPENCQEILSKAIKALLGLDLVDVLMTDLNVLEKRKNISLKSKEEIEEIRKAENEVTLLENEQTKLIQKEAELNNKVVLLEKELISIDDQFRAEGGELFEQKVALEAEQKKLRNSLDAKDGELREFAAGPAPLLLVTDLLESIEKQDRREEASERTKVVVETLNKRDRAIIKELKKKGTEEELIKNIKRLFQKDCQARSSEIISDSYLGLNLSAREQVRALNGSLLNQLKKQSIKLAQEAEALTNELDVVEKKIASIPDEESIAKLIRKRNELKEDALRSSIEIEKIEEKLRKLASKLELAQNRLNSQIEYQVKADFENEDVNRIIRTSSIARKSLYTFRDRIMKKHLQQIQNNILESLGHLYRKKSLVTNVSINPDDLSLTLQQKNGKIIPPDRLSAGERQLLSISILWGLARTSGRPLPTIIDTPLGRLDSSHRKHLVERYFPFASHQVLLLSTDEEINEKYYGKLNKFIGHQYRLKFSDRTESTTIEPGYFWEG